MNRSKKILVVGDPDLKDVFVPNFIKHIKRSRPNYCLTVLALKRLDAVAGMYEELGVEIVSPFSDTRCFFEKLPKIRTIHKAVKVNRVLLNLGQYDICHIHYIDPFIFFIRRMIEKRCRFTIASIYGSDFYRTSSSLKQKQRSIYECAAKITFTNAVTLSDFNYYYDHVFEPKTYTLRYGLATLEMQRDLASIPSNVCKFNLGIDPDCTLVTCGSNGSPYQQHAEMIAALSAERSKLPADTVFLFPMTYGCSSDYVEFIRNRLTATGLKFKILDTFLSDKEVAYIRRASDLFINVQKTDQLSGAMQEHLYANNAVITGSWLPYDCFEQRGIMLNKIDSLQQLGEKVSTVLKDLDAYKAEPSLVSEVIWEMSSWETCIEKWLALYDSLEC